MVKTELSTLEKCSITAVTSILVVIALLMVYPFVQIASTSFSSGVAANQGRVILLPVEPNLDTWKYILRDSSLWRSLGVSIYITVIGTVLSLAFSSLFAYPLSNRNYRWRKVVMFLVMLTMIFRHPVIPYFLTIRNLGLMDTLWSQILPHLIIVYNLVLLRTFFMQIPAEMEEAAIVEGANPFQVLIKVILPLSKPALATQGIFFAVTYWNLFMHPLMFIQNPKLFPLQVRLRSFLDLMENDAMISQLSVHFRGLSLITIEAATIIFGTMPILLVYPFLQKHFVKGAMIGSLKG